MKSLILIVTTACNMNCKFCLRNRQVSNLNFNLFRKILKQAKKLGYDTIGITGGEAYMYPKFYDLIYLIVKEGFKFILVSNGLYYEKYKSILKYKKNLVGISFSLDAGTSKLHDLFRGKGSFKKVKEAVKFFVKKGVRVRTQICLNKINKNEIEKFVRLSVKLGVDNCQFLSVIPRKDNLDLILSDKERGECIDKINFLKLKTKIPLRIMSSLQAGTGINFCPALNLTDMAVNPNGELIFCCDTVGDGAVIGDLRKESLKKLIEKGKKVSQFLKEKRTEHYDKKEFFEGFNTCKFCNYYLGCYKNKNNSNKK